jgi:hypothetical protein
MVQKISLLLISIAIGTCSYSQCDKKITLSATGAEILNEQNEVKIKDTERATTILFDSKVFEIKSGNNTLHGTIDSTYCNWKIPFKEGKTYIKGILYYENGDKWVTKLTIIGKESNITLLVDIDHPEANRMRFLLDKFEESK